MDRSDLNASIKAYMDDVVEVMGRLSCVCQSLVEGASIASRLASSELNFDSDLDQIKRMLELVMEDGHSIEASARAMSTGAKVHISWIQKEIESAGSAREDTRQGSSSDS